MSFLFVTPTLKLLITFLFSVRLQNRFGHLTTLKLNPRRDFFDTIGYLKNFQTTLCKLVYIYLPFGLYERRLMTTFSTMTILMFFESTLRVVWFRKNGSFELILTCINLRVPLSIHIHTHASLPHSSHSSSMIPFSTEYVQA